MTTVEPTTTRPSTTLDELRVSMGELFGAERRLRGREQQQPRDLTHSQLRALIVLDKAVEVTAGELAKSADLNPASVTAMLDQLEAERDCRAPSGQSGPPGVHGLPHRKPIFPASRSITASPWSAPW